MYNAAIYRVLKSTIYNNSSSIFYATTVFVNYKRYRLMEVIYIALTGLFGMYLMSWLYFTFMYEPPKAVGVDGIIQSKQLDQYGHVESTPTVIELLDNSTSRNDYIVDGEMVYYKGKVSLGDIVKIIDSDGKLEVHKYKVTEIYKDGFCDLININNKLPINLRRSMEHKDRLVVHKNRVD